MDWCYNNRGNDHCKNHRRKLVLNMKLAYQSSRTVSTDSPASPEKDTPAPDPASWIRQFFEEQGRNLRNLVKWFLLAVITGVGAGGVSCLFSYILTKATGLREAREWIFLLLPAAGLAIVFLYEKFDRNDGGTNQVFSTIRERDDIPVYSAPLVFISTVLTHLTGGSAGREGAAIQIGGSIGDRLGRLVRLDEEDRHVIIMCGMSAAFSAVFGTPLAAAVFSMEAVSVGVMYYAALFPCMTASLTASALASVFGIEAERYRTGAIPPLTLENALKIALVALICAAVSILFCLLLSAAANFYGRFFKNPYLRVAAAGCLIIIITFILRTDDYMGSGSNLIVQAVEHGQARWYTFLLKMLLTALTMRAGFRGGEIVPSFSIGAALGCVLGQLIGISPSIAAAAGMTALFCGVTNCPLTSLLIAFELFGFGGAPYYFIAAAVSYAASGYYGLYKDQTIVYSKYKARYINRHIKIFPGS